jgi:hypothetical protein
LALKAGGVERSALGQNDKIRGLVQLGNEKFHISHRIAALPEEPPHAAATEARTTARSERRTGLADRFGLEDRLVSSMSSADIKNVALAVRGYTVPQLVR